MQAMALHLRQSQDQRCILVAQWQKSPQHGSRKDSCLIWKHPLAQIMAIASRNQEVINDGAAGEDLLTQAISHPKLRPKASAGGSHQC